jgi:hypothetical protein
VALRVRGDPAKAVGSRFGFNLSRKSRRLPLAGRQREYAPHLTHLTAARRLEIALAQSVICWRSADCSVEEALALPILIADPLAARVKKLVAAGF